MSLAASPRGAYGFAVMGLDDASALMPVPGDWPGIRIDQRVNGETTIDAADEPDVKRIRLIEDGLLVADRRRARATFVTRSPLGQDDLAHPYLAAAAAPFAGWLGRAAFHAGAFLTADGAWALLGDKEDGKSTLLASLALAGVAVLTDDVLVAEKGKVFAGPRCIDLRDSAARALDVMNLAVPARSGGRARLALAPAIELVAPLRGWILLTWGEELALRTVPPADRLRVVASRTGRSAAPAPSDLLDLAALPAWELRRPRRLDLLDETRQLLLDALSM